MKIIGESISYSPKNTIDFIVKVFELHHKFLLSERKQILSVERDDKAILHIGIGYIEGIFIEHIANVNSSYFMTYDNSKEILKKKVMVYFYFGHWSEIQACHLLSLGIVTNILSDFFEYKTLNFSDGNWIEE